MNLVGTLCGWTYEKITEQENNRLVLSCKELENFPILKESAFKLSFYYIRSDHLLISHQDLNLSAFLPNLRELIIESFTEYNHEVEILINNLKRCSNIKKLIK